MSENNYVIKYVRANDKELSQIVPRRFLEGVTADNCRLFTCVDEDRVIGVILYTTSFKSDHYELKYIYTAENMRNSGIVSQMINDTRDILSKNHVKRVSAYLSPDYSDMGKLLAEQGFVNKGNSTMMGFSIVSMLDSGFRDGITNMDALIDRVLYLNELSKSAREEFSAHYKKINSGVNLNSLNKLFTRFFVVNDRVVGFINIEEIQENILLVNDIYVRNIEYANYARPALIAATLASTEAFLSEYSVLIMRSDQEQLVNAMIHSFGEPISKEINDLMEINI